MVVDPSLKALLRDRHIHEYQLFAAEYRCITRELGLPRSAAPPSKATYYHWLSGQMKGLPYGYHCLVLETMFPGWTAKELFTRSEKQSVRTASDGMLASITPSVDPAQLAGLWCTGFIFAGGRHHVDLTTVTVTNGVVTARNFPPAPCSEGLNVGFHNDISLTVSGRHLIGQWRNSSDSYYYGSIHLALLPGETILDGYYTGIVTDTEVAADRWRWVRVEPQSLAGIDLHTVNLGDPQRVYNVLIKHAEGGPSAAIALAQLMEKP
jgi:hypothetical protein